MNYKEDIMENPMCYDDLVNMIQAEVLEIKTTKDTYVSMEDLHDFLSRDHVSDPYGTLHTILSTQR